MKKVIVKILFYFLFLNNCFAQPFGANNAVWHYEVYSQMPPYVISPVTINSSCTIILGIPYCTFSINPGTCATSSGYSTYQSNDSVYYFLPSTNKWAMLYNFNAMPGDTQTIYGELSSGLDSIILKVDTAGIININGYNKKFYTTSNILFPSFLAFGGMMIEDIGCTGFLFPQIGFCDPLVGGLRCYEDTIIGLYQPLQPGINCDTIIYLGEHELNFIPNFSIFPTPTPDYITIHYNETSNNKTTVTLVNLYGQNVYSENLKGLNEIKIDMRSFAAGIYFVKMMIDGKEEVRKILKY